MKRDDVWSSNRSYILFYSILFVPSCFAKPQKQIQTHEMNIHILSLCSMSFKVMEEHDFGGKCCKTLFSFYPLNSLFRSILFYAILILTSAHPVCVRAFICFPFMTLSNSNSSSLIFKYFVLIIFVEEKACYTLHWS